MNSMNSMNSSLELLTRLAISCVVSTSLGCDADPRQRAHSEQDRGDAAGSDADDTLHGGEGPDLLEGHGGSDRLFGGEGPDELLGGDQGDMLHGGPGDDVLEGGPGPDLLNGGPDSDELYGGPSSDYYVVEAGQGDDVIDDSGGSHDRLTLAGLSPEQVETVRAEDDLLITVPGGSVRIVGHFTTGAIELIDYEWGQDSFTSLDYGIHWFGPGNDRAKYIPTVDNPYFDPSRPTMLLAHGWQKGSIPSRRRPGLNYSSSDAPDRDMADAWIDAGWNVGVFYWQNFADESEVKNAEGKIWSSSGRNDQGMRWRSQDDGYSDWPFDFSIGQLAHGSITAALLEANAPTVRLAGHSLGNQLVSVVASALQRDVDGDEVSPRLRPERVSLLDPFWSKGTKDYLGGQSTGTRSLALVRDLMSAGVAVDAYRSSAVTSNPFIGDSNETLFRDVCLVELRPHYFGAFNQGKKHMVGLWHYVMGFEFPEMRDDLGEPVATAASDVGVIWDCIEGGYRWDQVEGKTTKTPEDDGYQRIDEG